MSRLLTWCAAALLGAVAAGCAARASVEGTAAQLQEWQDEAVTATGLPVDRTTELPQRPVPCEIGAAGPEGMLVRTVSADDPEDGPAPWGEALVAHLRDAGWTVTAVEERPGGDGASTNTYTTLERDDWTARVSVVFGAEATGVDLELRSPCRVYDVGT